MPKSELGGAEEPTIDILFIQLVPDENNIMLFKVRFDRNRSQYHIQPKLTVILLEDRCLRGAKGPSTETFLKLYHMATNLIPTHA